MLITILAIISLAAGCGLAFGFGEAWYFFILWSIPLFFLANGLFLAFAYISSLFLPTDDSKKYDSPFCRKIVWMTMQWILFWTRVKVIATGLEKIPGERFVIVSNHLSKYDPMVKYVLIKNKKLAFISKKENLEIPIAGRYIRLAGFLPLDRENPLRAMRCVRKAADMIKTDGFSFGVYPEGTRSRDGELLEFKPGAFVIAQKANAPVVVSVIRGTEKIKKNSPWRRTTINLDVLEVIPVEKVTSMKAEEISDYCYGVMKEHLESCR